MQGHHHTPSRYNANSKGRHWHLKVYETLRHHQSFLVGIHRPPVDSQHNGPTFHSFRSFLAVSLIFYQPVQLPIIWDTFTSMGRHCNEYIGNKLSWVWATQLQNIAWHLLTCPWPVSNISQRCHMANETSVVTDIFSGQKRSLYSLWLSKIRASISDYHRYEWDVITHPCRNINDNLTELGQGNNIP